MDLKQIHGHTYRPVLNIICLYSADYIPPPLPALHASLRIRCVLITLLGLRKQDQNDT